MNPTRVALAAIAATVLDGIYGFVVYGTLMAPQFANFPGVFRSAETGPAYLPVMFCGILVGMSAISYVYATGYESGNGLREGLRFGLLIAIFNAGYVIGTDYGVLNIGRRLALAMALAGLGEWLLVGGTIGLVYKHSKV